MQRYNRSEVGIVIFALSAQNDCFLLEHENESRPPGRIKIKIKQLLDKKRIFYSKN
jgi:hypothetical protein